MSPTTLSKEELLALIQESSYLRNISGNGRHLERAEKVALGALRLRARLSSTPFYAERAQGDPNYWYTLQSSCVNL
jgi:hypothetical protein